MHKYNISATPYFCEITIDPSLAYAEKDLSVFKSKIEQGVAVYGYSPNVLVVEKGTYDHWNTLCVLVSALNKGKLAICGTSFPRNFLEVLRSSNPAVEVRLYGAGQGAEGREWVRC